MSLRGYPSQTVRPLMMRCMIFFVVKLLYAYGDFMVEMYGSAYWYRDTGAPVSMNAPHHPFALVCDRPRTGTFSESPCFSR